MELTNKVAGITDRSYKARMLLTDWMKVYHDYVMKRGGTKSASRWINCCIAELEEYNGKVTLAEVDREYLLGFMERLLTRKAYTRDHGKLAKETVFYTWIIFVRHSIMPLKKICCRNLHTRG